MTGPNENILVYKKPIGVVAGIIPWNFPVFILARKVATALMTGCTVVIKPSQHTPNTTMEFTRIVDEMSEVPAGIYNVVTGAGSEIGNALASHKDLNEAMRVINEMKFGETYVNRENFRGFPCDPGGLYAV